jgi:hypothetical protein
MPVVPDNCSPENFRFVADRYVSLLEESRFLWQQASDENLERRQIVARSIIFCERTLTYYCGWVDPSNSVVVDTFALLREAAYDEEARGCSIPEFKWTPNFKSNTPKRERGSSLKPRQGRAATYTPAPAPVDQTEQAIQDFLFG